MDFNSERMCDDNVWGVDCEMCYVKCEMCMYFVRDSCNRDMCCRCDFCDFKG